MTSSVSRATLDALARRLDELAADFPTSPADVDPVALTDHIGLLAHHLDHLTARTQDRLATTQPVYLPERHVLAELADAARAITGAPTSWPKHSPTPRTPSARRPSPTSRPPTCATTRPPRGSSPARSTPPPAPS